MTSFIKGATALFGTAEESQVTEALNLCGPQTPRAAAVLLGCQRNLEEPQGYVKLRQHITAHI